MGWFAVAGGVAAKPMGAWPANTAGSSAAWLRCKMSVARSLIGRGQGGVRGRRQIAAGGVPVQRVLGHAARDHLVEGRRNTGPGDAGPWDRLVQVRAHHADLIALVRRRSGQALVQDAGQGIDVGAVSDLGVAEPFRSHVLEGADRGAELRELLVGGGAGDPEVDQVREVVLTDQDVLRFDVAMCDTGRVRGVERSANLAHDCHRARRRQRSVPAQDHGRVQAVDQTHVHEELAVDLAVVVNRDDVGFLQPARGAGLALHAGAEHRIAGQRLRHQLQGDDALPDRVLGLVGVAHPAATHQPSQQIGPELRALPRTRGVTHRLLLCARHKANSLGQPGAR